MPSSQHGARLLRALWANTLVGKWLQANDKNILITVIKTWMTTTGNYSINHLYIFQLVNISVKLTLRQPKVATLYPHQNTQAHMQELHADMQCQDLHEGFPHLHHGLHRRKGAWPPPHAGRSLPTEGWPNHAWLTSSTIPSTCMRRVYFNFNDLVLHSCHHQSLFYVSQFEFLPLTDDTG